jgi:DNA polymerase (family 10)
MADAKQEALEMLRELAELTILDEGDPQSFRVRAYENATHGIAAHPGDLRGMTVKELQQIENVGKSTAEKVHELFTTGKVAKLEALREKHPPGVVALLGIQGVGPKMVKRLRAELGVASVEDLRAAVAAHRVRDLKGLGEKSEENLARALDRMEGQKPVVRTPIAIALPLATSIADGLRAVAGVSDVCVCGSLRRFAETIGDIDIVVAARDAAPVMAALVAMPIVDRVLGHGDTKTSVVTRQGIQVDVRVVAKPQLGAAMLYFSGSKAHNIKLRQRALGREMTLNEYALSEVEGGKVVASETEEQIYQALGLPWIPPVLREDAGEIEAALDGSLPQPIAKVIGDFHVHTALSGDARSSLEEVVAAAQARGLRFLAITEHAEGVAAGVSREALNEQRANIQALQRRIGPSLTLLHGVELNIGPDGELSYDAEFRKTFDFCLASIHDHYDLDRAAQTRRVVTAMRDPAVRMIGHLSGRHIGKRVGIEIDIDAVFAAAEETGTALEINGTLSRLDLSVEGLHRAKHRKVNLVLTSDAHHANDLDRIRFAVANAERGWAQPDRIANAWPEDRLAAWLQRKSPAE